MRLEIDTRSETLIRNTLVSSLHIYNQTTTYSHSPQKPLSNHPPQSDSPINLGVLLQILQGDVRASTLISVIRHFLSWAIHIFFSFLFWDRRPTKPAPMHNQREKTRPHRGEAGPLERERFTSKECCDYISLLTRIRRRPQSASPRHAVRCHKPVILNKPHWPILPKPWEVTSVLQAWQKSGPLPLRNCFENQQAHEIKPWDHRVKDLIFRTPLPFILNPSMRRHKFSKVFSITETRRKLPIQNRFITRLVHPLTTTAALRMSRRFGCTNERALNYI